MSLSIPNAFTVDVEDYYQVSGFEDRICRSQWDKLESRVERSTDQILSLMDETGIRGTFFILGWVAERFPQLVKRIAAADHEIASHGYWHKLVYQQTPEEFAKDIADSCDAIANACGFRPTAYRAPSFSITRESLWALDILVELGFTCDSSVFPIRGHHRYGVPNAKLQIHERDTAAGPIKEFPPSIARLAKAQLPVGGGYFRLLPLRMTVHAVRSIEKQGRPVMFYIHPWEIDPEQPRIGGLSRSTSFRHYIGLERTEGKLRKLIGKFDFGTMTQAMRRVEKAVS
jgi:polysaccharide deacetylase family protein (PEP-CTERM system associated)